MDRVNKGFLLDASSSTEKHSHLRQIVRCNGVDASIDVAGIADRYESAL